jgi:hypothetical protein
MMQGPWLPGQIGDVVIPIGPVGRAIGRVILHLFGADRQQALPAEDVAHLRALLEDQADRLEAQQRQLAELAERQDFAERLLAQSREKRALGEGGGG